jgi:predicted ATPase
LVAEATAGLLGDGMPEGVGLRELGRVELRDVGRSEVVYCLTAEHLAALDVRDVVGSTDARRGWLPAIEDELVGRSAEIGAVVDAIDAFGVVSIVGVGGMGKTRLALEAATAAKFPDGAWWCDLAAVTAPDAVPAAVLAVFGARQSSGRSATECLVEHLSGLGVLVVFDNCEHVIDAARTLVGSIRAGCPAVRVLATSREALVLRGEHVISLSSLPAGDAVGLFCTRAAEARADLAFDDATLGAVSEICGQLDGIPLAIELAAARCRSMAPAEIAVRLDDRFRLLRGGRGGVERHQTLHAAVDWSYSLLDPEECALFECLAVFADGGLLDAITEVSGLDEYDALDLLDRLVARSMVVAIDTQLGTRYRQLETLRQYAEGRLVEHGRIDATRDRHLSWVQTLTGWLRTTDGTGAEMAGYWRYAAELDNIRAAVHYAIAAQRLEAGCNIIGGLTLPAFWRASYEIIDWFDPTTIPPHDWTDGVASVAGFQAVFAVFAGDHARAFALIDCVPDEYGRNFEVLHAGTYASLWVRPDTGAAQATLDAIAPHDYYESFVEAVLRTHLSIRRLYTDGADDPDVAAAALERVNTWIVAIRAADQRLTLACALLTAGGLVDILGDWNRAVVMSQESLDLAEGTGAELLTDFALSNLTTSLTKLTGAEPERLAGTAASLRSILVNVLQRRNTLAQSVVFTSAGRLVRLSGDEPTGFLLFRFASLMFPMNSETDATFLEGLDAETITRIEHEAAQLDTEQVGAIALAALDRIIAEPTGLSQ